MVGASDEPKVSYSESARHHHHQRQAVTLPLHESNQLQKYKNKI